MSMEINGNLFDYSVKKQNYSSVYENTYAASKKEVANKEETKKAAATKKSAETAKKSGSEEYLKTLQKQVPYIKLQTGYGLNTSKDGKVNVVDVNPKLLEKMQSDPQAAKEYTQRLKDVEAATKWVDNFEKSMGYTAVVRHGYINENGIFSNFAVVVRKDELNEKLRKEEQENAKKQIEKTRENARQNVEQIAEKLEEKAEQLLDEKLSKSKDGTIYLYDTDMQTIIEAAKEDKAASKQQAAVYTQVDVRL